MKLRLSTKSSALNIFWVKVRLYGRYLRTLIRVLCRVQSKQLFRLSYTMYYILEGTDKCTDESLAILNTML